MKTKRPLLIVAPVDQQVKAALLMNKVKGNIKVNIVNLPGFGPTKIDTVADLAFLVGAKVFNGCGQFKLDESASLVQQANWIITHDTGLMHIAAAFKKRIVSVWGNTVPELGMYPYLPDPSSKIVQIKGLSCRPCSKIGYSKCPKSHFKCMEHAVSDLKI